VGQTYQTNLRRRSPAPLLIGSLLGLALLNPGVASAQSPAPYMVHTWRSALNAPWPALSGAQLLGLLNGGIGPVIPLSELDPNGTGWLGTYNLGGGTSPSPTVVSKNAFFASLGTNGRTCGTCHQPASGMSVSLNDLTARYLVTGGNDPIFAPVDGANCPSAVPAGDTRPSYYGGRLGAGKSMASAHSLLLSRGVFRIFLPVPAAIPALPPTFTGAPDPRSGQPAEFTVKVIHDPNGCNTDPTYAQDPVDGTPILSNYRRPLISTNLKFVTSTASPFGPPAAFSGNIMWDGREATLSSQALDATLGHAQAIPPGPNAAQVQQMVDFESFLYSAQAIDARAGSLSAGGATGGPIALSGLTAGQLAGPLDGIPVFSQFTAWSTVTGKTPAALQQQSIYRGQQIYNTKLFTISNVAGFSDVVGVNPPLTNTCASCHSQLGAGSDSFPNAQHDLGVAGDAAAEGGPAPAQDLPIFEVTCSRPAGGSTEFLGYNQDGTNRAAGAMILVNDLGAALISGLCADIGKFTVPPLRALASRPPYFHDGSASSLSDVVNFYNKRFNIGFTAQEKTDLVNFLSAL
jgi:cytochrome c peroxidase